MLCLFSFEICRKNKSLFCCYRHTVIRKKSGYRLLFAPKTVGSYFPKIKMKYFNFRIVNVLRLVKLVLVKKKKKCMKETHIFNQRIQKLENVRPSWFGC